MRRDKTVAQIFLIFFVVNVALVAPAVIRPGHLEVAEDVIVALEPEKRGDKVVAPEELPDLSGSSTPPGPPHTSSQAPPKHATWDDASGWVPDSESDQSETLPGPEPVSGSDQSQHFTVLTTPASGSTSSHHDSAPELSAPPAQDNSAPMSGVSQLHNDPPSGSRAQPLHTDSLLGPNSLHSTDSDESYRYFQRVIAGAGLEPWLSQGMSHSESSESSATAEKFLTDELKRKMKDYAVLGTVIGGSVGLLYGVQKEIMGTVSPGAETIGRDLASSDVARRGAGTRLYLLDHILPRNDPVSFGLSNMRDKDLRLLGVLTRRALESLD